MATSLSTLIDRTRRFAQDWPDQDSLTASCTSVTTTLSVADTTIYSKNWDIEIDQEVCTVRALTSATVLTVKRAAKGSTAATHANSAPVLIRPSFPAVQIIDALNQAKDEAFPYIYKAVLDTSLTTSSQTFEYTVPNMTSPVIPIPFISAIDIKFQGELDYRPIRSWSIRRGATPKIQFRREQTPNSTLRVSGYGPFPDWTAISDAVDGQWPQAAEKFLPIGATSVLLASGEAGRVRVDTLANDMREEANRVGSSMQTSSFLYQRFLRAVQAAAPGPMPKHVKSTF